MAARGPQADRPDAGAARGAGRRPLRRHRRRLRRTRGPLGAAPLALAAWKLRRVGIVWSREESIIGHHKRHPFRIRCRWGATRDGRITAVEAEVLADGGAYASTSAEVTKVATLFATGGYEIPNIAVDG